MLASRSRTVLPLAAKSGCRTAPPRVSSAVPSLQRTLPLPLPLARRLDDSGKLRVNRGFRVQFSSAIGPYKVGARSTSAGARPASCTATVVCPFPFLSAPPRPRLTTTYLSTPHVCPLPCQGGLRFREGVRLSIIKMLG